MPDRIVYSCPKEAILVVGKAAGMNRGVKPVLYEVWASAGIRALWGRGIQHRFPHHAHASYQLGQVLTGARVLELSDNRAVRVEAGGMFLLNPNQRHTCRPDGCGGQDYFVLSFDAGQMRRLLASTPDTLATPHFRQVTWADRMASEALSCLRGLLLDGGDGLALEDAAANILHLLLSSGVLQSSPEGNASGLVSYGPDDAGPDWRLQKAKEYIEANFAGKLSLAEIATQAYLSEFHFQRRFLQAFGFSPLEYTEKLRIREAARLLSVGSTAASAALAVGFSDQSHFCRVFRKLTGVTPQQYRTSAPETSG